MDRAADGRFPAQAQIAQACPPDSHAAGRQDDEAEIAMPDFDHVHALGQPGLERSLDDAIAVGRPADLFGPQGDSVNIEILVAVNKRPSSGRHDAWSSLSRWVEQLHGF